MISETNKVKIKKLDLSKLSENKFNFISKPQFEDTYPFKITPQFKNTIEQQNIFANQYGNSTQNINIDLSVEFQELLNKESKTFQKCLDKDQSFDEVIDIMNKQKKKKSDLILKIKNEYYNFLNQLSSKNQFQKENGQFVNDNNNLKAMKRQSSLCMDSKSPEKYSLSPQRNSQNMLFSYNVSPIRLTYERESSMKDESMVINLLKTPEKWRQITQNKLKYNTSPQNINNERQEETELIQTERNQANNNIQQQSLLTDQLPTQRKPQSKLNYKDNKSLFLFDDGNIQIKMEFQNQELIEAIYEIIQVNLFQNQL